MMIIACVMWFASQDAQAFYNPSPGRWLNRDPLVDNVFLASYLERSSRSEHKRLRLEILQPVASFLRNDPVDKIDFYGLIGLQDPLDVPAPRPLSPCELAIAGTAKMLGNINNDKRAHCIASCQIAKTCGQWVCKCLGNIKESRDLGAGAIQRLCSWVLKDEAQEWLREHLQGGNIDDSAGDFEANEWGMGLAKYGGDCVKDCEARYGPEPE
jgi:hypothetical protein